MFYDVHAHLTSREYADVEEVISDCSEKNVVVVSNGLNYEDNKKVLGLSEEYGSVLPSFGMHPCEGFDERVIEQIRMNENEIISMGEVGLDFTKNNHSEQVGRFKQFLELGEELKLPLIIHSRGAQRKVLELIREYELSVVLHAFFTNKKLIKQAVNMRGVYLSIPANAVYSTQVQMMIKLTPLNKLLCETDSPYLWKHGLNTPVNVLKSYKEVSTLKNTGLKEVEEGVESNFQAIFKNIEVIQ